jgi:hypothetical protein
MATGPETLRTASAVSAQETAVAESRSNEQTTLEHQTIVEVLKQLALLRAGATDLLWLPRLANPATPVVLLVADAFPRWYCAKADTWQMVDFTTDK